MMQSNDSGKISSGLIKSQINTTKEQMETSLEEIKNTLMNIKIKTVQSQKKNEDEINYLNSQITNLCNLERELKLKNEEISEKIDEEERRLEVINSENVLFENQYKDVKSAYNNLYERYAELKDIIDLSQTKLENIQNKNEEVNDSKKLLSEKFRKYLGIDFKKAKENMLRVSFTNLSEPCYFLISFACIPTITETSPNLDISLINNCFSQCGNLFDFLKFIRNEFIRELK